LVGPAHFTPGAIICSEILSTLDWGSNVPRFRRVLHGSCATGLTVERLCTSKGDLALGSLSAPRNYLAYVADVDRIKKPIQDTARHRRHPLTPLS